MWCDSSRHWFIARSNAHHKNSLKLILNEKQLPFTSIERRIIANVARYHRKGCPKTNHYNFMSLNRELRRKVTIVAGILRLADGLDFSHQSIVEHVEANVNLDNITVSGVVVSKPDSRKSKVSTRRRIYSKDFRKKIGARMEISA